MMKRYVILIIIIIGVYESVFAQILTLDSCKAYALENNKRIKEARMNLEASREIKKNAFTNYFPKLNAGGAIIRADKGLLDIETPDMNLPVYDGNPANIPNATQFAFVPGMHLELMDYVNAGFISAIEPIYMGGRIRNGNKLASLGEEISEYQLRLSTDEIIVKTQEYFWTIVALEEKQKTLQGYEELLNNLHKDVQISYESGLISKSDLLKVEIELNQINTNKLKLTNGLNLLKMALAQHIGVSYTDTFEIEKATLNVTNPESEYQDPREALLSRNEYKMLQKSKDAEILQRNISRGEYLPTLAVGVQGLYLGVLGQQNTHGLAYAMLTIPISDWWGGSYKMKEHKIKIETAQNNLDEKSELLILQINKAYHDMLESYSQIGVAQRTLEQAEEHLKVVKDNYEAGVVSTSDLLEAQAMHQESVDALVDAKTMYKIKQAYYMQTIARVEI